MELRINSTGVRSGELITSSPLNKQAKNTKFRLRGFYPPSKTWVNKLTDIELRDVLNNIPFFSSMNKNERKQWLIENAVNNDDLYMDDVEGLYIKFYNISGPFMLKSLSSEQISMLLNGNPEDPEGYWLLKDVYNMFPRKPNSKAHHHTLIFRPNNWVLEIEDNVVEGYAGIYITLNPIGYNYGLVESVNYVVHNLQHDSENITPAIAIIIPDDKPYSNIMDIILEYVKNDIADEIIDLISWFPPSLHKSLIQKLIRTRCKFTSYGNKKYSARDMLIISFCLLLDNPGSFVPDLQKYVSGLESATKRLAVATSEDSFTTDHNILLSLYSSALLKQLKSDWKPSEQLIKTWIEFAVEVQQNNKIFKYETQTFTGIANLWDSSPEDYTMMLNYLLLNELRSFKTDINLVGNIALNNGIDRGEYGEKNNIVMPLVHCVDHHTYADIAYYLPYDGRSYSEKFKEIWNTTVGVNPRLNKHREYYLIYENDPVVKEIRTAQHYLWLRKSYTPELRPKNKIVSTIQYKLDPSWLAGLIGPIELKINKTTAYIILRSDNIYDMLVIRKPSRDDKELIEYTEEEKFQGKTEALKLLSKGRLLLDNKLFPGAIVYYKSDDYYLTYKGETKLWDDWRVMKIKVPNHPEMDINILNAIIYTGNGIESQALKRFVDYSKDLDPKIIKRLLFFLSGYKSKINLFHLNRKGKSADYTVLPEDIAVSNILHYITVLIPSALELTPNGFNVKLGPLLWKLRDMITPNKELFEKWPVKKLVERQLWEHQRDSLQSMIDRHEEGKKGHILHMPVGSGKTSIVLSYVQYLIKNQQMPKYCVYSLPPSAMNSIIREIQIFNLPYNTIDMRLKSNTNTLVPFSINIINHDHMRMNGMDEQMREYSASMLFIVDEFHKTLNKTQRTSIALEISRLSADFIGLSGTLIKDTNPDDLIQWLEHVVDYEVNTKNYWVAIGAVISKKYQTKNIVIREDIDVPMEEDQLKYYQSLVPAKLGGTASTINFREAVNYCYEIITNYLVYYTLEFVNKGETVFLVAKDIEHQNMLAKLLRDNGVKSIFLIGKDNSIIYAPSDKRQIDVIITTIRHSEGYTLSKAHIMITSVYFSNEATREQLIGRLDRLDQPSDEIYVYTLHTGILTYVNEKYKRVHSLNTFLKQFAKDIDVDKITI